MACKLRLLKPVACYRLPFSKEKKLEPNLEMLLTSTSSSLSSSAGRSTAKVQLALGCVPWLLKQDGVQKEAWPPEPGWHQVLLMIVVLVVIVVIVLTIHCSCWITTHDRHIIAG